MIETPLYFLVQPNVYTATQTSSSLESVHPTKQQVCKQKRRQASKKKKRKSEDIKSIKGGMELLK
ncbi:uncharacterized protein LACBIDRAFT_312471 [Laccaria bicolor S238N-H82]|uniref:Predicted protein n=1 Tax=Laccaria bicolor (strain S238N-H82 / ATCC MYA-4686) TaxID=486041 RepID=B0DW91_LACBS|nr:uncharacterized protein LACBIDRAFT_312471 [Laccaria bicolor S238N-H82]EDR01147.1 predicted protein [Laccaria bicolor S238N-H82]|eukprot:XP_001888189.1 predicted protein [Laccaria bicolor S238N-H82]